MKAYIYEGYYPAGGTYMAYHIGRVLYQYFGLDVIIVGGSGNGMMFLYELNFPLITRDIFEAEIRTDDLLVCNPSFSDLGFGQKISCRKLSYVQGVTTYEALDTQFDFYVFVSKWVRMYVQQNYLISGNVIPAFIDTEIFFPQVEWERREKEILVMEYKNGTQCLEHLLALYRRKYRDLPSVKIIPMIKHEELGRFFNHGRYFLSLASMEGFGLPMLEAMASGCTVIGWDAGGSAEYAKHGKNCLLAQYGDIESLIDQLYYALHNDEISREIAINAAFTGKKFARIYFDDLWIKEFRSLGYVCKK